MHYEKAPDRLTSTFYTGTKNKYDNLGQELIYLPSEIEDMLRINMMHRILRNILGYWLYIEWLYESQFIDFKAYKEIRVKALDRLNEL